MEVVVKLIEENEENGAILEMSITPTGKLLVRTTRAIFLLDLEREEHG